MTTYETITLSVGTDEALSTILSTVEGLVANETADGVRIRTSQGVKVAELRADGDGSALTYRADPSLSPRGDATRKARHVRESVDEFAE